MTKQHKPGAGFFTRHDRPGRVKLSFKGEKSRTHQSMKSECDINNIVKSAARFGAQGLQLVPHQNNQPARYLDCNAQDYYEAINMVMAAQQQFEALPAEVRRRFENEPLLFLEFIQDDKNKEEAATLGLLSPEALEAFQRDKKAADDRLANKRKKQSSSEAPKPAPKKGEPSEA